MVMASSTGSAESCTIVCACVCVCVKRSALEPDMRTEDDNDCGQTTRNKIIYGI